MKLTKGIFKFQVLVQINLVFLSLYLNWHFCLFRTKVGQIKTGISVFPNVYLLHIQQLVQPNKKLNFIFPVSNVHWPTLHLHAYKE